MWALLVVTMGDSLHEKVEFMCCTLMLLVPGKASPPTTQLRIIHNGMFYSNWLDVTDTAVSISNLGYNGMFPSVPKMSTLTVLKCINP